MKTKRQPDSLLNGKESCRKLQLKHTMLSQNSFYSNLKEKCPVAVYGLVGSYPCDVYSLLWQCSSKCESVEAAEMAVLGLYFTAEA